MWREKRKFHYSVRIVEEGGDLSRQLKSGPERQSELLREKANSGEIPLSFWDLEFSARHAMAPEAFAYVAGSAGAEKTYEANIEAFEGHRIVPRMLRDVKQRDLSVELFGSRLETPILLAPVGVQEIMHAEAEIATARACALSGTPLIISNQASRSIEQIVPELGQTPAWFQLYWSNAGDIVASLVRRAEESGCKALVVTLDTHMLGWRPRDLGAKYSPFVLGKGLAQYFTDPVFCSKLNRSPEEDPYEAVRLFSSIFPNPSLTWGDLRSLRDQTSMPIVLKGINHAEDAISALDYGVDGIIVSNHGGRQVDGAIASLDALSPVVAAIEKRLPVLFDSGIRTGADVFKAIALGATAVCVGRPYAYGLALGGTHGVDSVIRNLVGELDLTLGLAGFRSVKEVGRAALAKYAHRP